MTCPFLSAVLVECHINTLHASLISVTALQKQCVPLDAPVLLDCACLCVACCVSCSGNPKERLLIGPYTLLNIRVHIIWHTVVMFSTVDYALADADSSIMGGLMRKGSAGRGQGRAGHAGQGRVTCPRDSRSGLSVYTAQQRKA